MTTFNLTTTFTPPSNCFTDIYRYNANQLVGPMTASCYPQGWTNTTTTFYSPGICPSGYSTACIRAETANTITETIATCCPTSHECASTNNHLGCHTSISGGISQLVTVMNSDYSSVSTIHTELIGGYINAYGVQIRFQATDLQHVTSTTSTSITASSSGATIPRTHLNSHSGLSTGAKAGIGVGAVLAVCIGLVLLWFEWRRIKRRRALLAQAREPERTRDGGRRESDGVKYTPMEAKYNGISEMQGTALSEAPADDLRREFEGHHMAHRHELDGRGR